MNHHLKAANGNQSIPTGSSTSARSPRLLEWLTKLTQPGFTIDLLHEAYEPQDISTRAPAGDLPQHDDWVAVFHVCGYGASDFADAGANLPLTEGEIDHFRRNHRGTEKYISRDFLAAQTDLPSPLSELYSLYLHRVRIDVESALFLAQATTSTRVARTMADLTTIGAFANGLEYVSYLGVSYSVPAAFDTAASVDRANSEALRRLTLPADHPSHLLTLKPDELSVLGASIAEKTALSSDKFLEKCNLLAESRQDVTRLPTKDHFATAVREQDICLQTPWGVRMATAYARLLPRWVVDLPEIQSVLN